MNGRKWIKAIALATAITACTAHAYNYDLQTVDDYTSWPAFVNNGVVTLQSSGANSLSTGFTDSFTDAFYLAIIIKTADCPGYCQASINRYVGTYKGYDLRMDIRLYKSGDSQEITFRIQSINLETNKLVERPIWGSFNDHTESGWDFNQPVGVAIGIKGNELVYYVSTLNVLQKIELFGAFVPYDEPAPYFLVTYSETKDDFIQANFTGFTEVGLIPSVMR